MISESSAILSLSLYAPTSSPRRGCQVSESTPAWDQYFFFPWHFGDSSCKVPTQISAEMWLEKSSLEDSSPARAQIVSRDRNLIFANPDDIVNVMWRMNVQHRGVPQDHNTSAFILQPVPCPTMPILSSASRSVRRKRKIQMAKNTSSSCVHHV